MRARDPQARVRAYHAANPNIYERIKQDLRTIIPTLKDGQRLRFREHVMYVTGSQATFYFRLLHEQEPDIAVHLWPLRPSHGKPPPSITLTTEVKDPLRVWEVAVETTRARNLPVMLANDAEDAEAKDDTLWFQQARAVLAEAYRELGALSNILDDPDYRRRVARNTLE